MKLGKRATGAVGDTGRGSQAAEEGSLLRRSRKLVHRDLLVNGNGVRVSLILCGRTLTRWPTACVTFDRLDGHLDRPLCKPVKELRVRLVQF